MTKSPIDRRARIFFGFSALSLMLVEAAPQQFRWVGLALSATYLVLGAASWIDLKSRTR